MRTIAARFVSLLAFACSPVLTAGQEPPRLELVLQAKSPPDTRGWGAAALSGDGQLAVTIDGKEAILWDCAAGRKLRTFQGHTDAIRSVAVSADAKHLVTGSQDRTAILWDLASGKKLRTFAGHTDHVHSVALTPDGKYALTGSEDRTAILWDAASGKKHRTFAGHKWRVTSVALSADGKLAVTGSGPEVTLWDAASGDKLRDFEAGELRDMALSADGKHLWTTAADQSVRLWGPSTGKERCRIYSFNMGDDWLVVTPDGRFDGSRNAWRFVAYREPGTVNLLDDADARKRFHRPGLLAEVWKAEE
jgi:WD40 repeat protein